MPASVPKIQIRHPITGRWILLNTNTGAVIKTRDHRWPDVPIKTADAVKR